MLTVLAIIAAFVSGWFWRGDRERSNVRRLAREARANRADLRAVRDGLGDTRETPPAHNDFDHGDTETLP